jgi:hypothetical protein
MNKLTRRAFLWRGSVAAGVAGAVAAVPGLPALLASESPVATTAVETAAPDASALIPEGASLSEPLVAHVRDLSTGAIDLFVGNQQIALNDTRLASQLYRATQ